LLSLPFPDGLPVVLGFPPFPFPMPNKASKNIKRLRIRCTQKNTFDRIKIQAIFNLHNNAHIFMDYEKLCAKIFELDKQIRLVAVYNSKTEKIAGGMRDGLVNHIPESITKLTVEQSFMRWDTRLEMKDWIGKPKFAFAEYDKVKRFTFYVNHDKLLLVSTELGVSNDFLIENIRKLL
jgi:hypothetical protein